MTVRQLPSETTHVVDTEVRGEVGIVTLARPDRLNALIPESMRQLRRALLDLGERRDVRVIVLRGEGRAFCAGLDLEAGRPDALLETPVEAFTEMMSVAVEVIMAIRSIPQPVVAAVHGHAVGAGFALAAAADVRFIAADARFSAPFLRLGMSVGDLGLSWFLPRLIGHGRASRVFYEAGVIDADQAVAWGLASEVSVDPLADAIAFAQQTAALPHYGVRASKNLINASASSSLRDHLDAEARAQVIGGVTPSAVQAMDAALQHTKEKKQ
ncbi:enoyl-CoA hydratase [Nocardioides daedukensis]|uniref:Enoyl-CoA hydratase n=1 Tax=Nocardioides daedukensis TaxID=634462 RepID=A0A7Y9UPM1_9ACTN|nr:enoyl-CoA hydratase/isomerase family protein [Nocardioides daedukensis]NYG59758.1 enoyl-CoA hydratase [Nocardioides daedukensis]